MTDATPTTTAPAAETAPTLIARAATAVVDSATSTRAAVMAFLAIPAVGTCLTLIIGGLVTWCGMAVKAHYEMPRAAIVMPASDAPKPTPVAGINIADVTAVVAERCGKLDGKLDALLERMPAPKVVPLKKTAARSVK